MFRHIDFGGESRLYYDGKLIASVNRVGFTIHATNSNLEVRSYKVSRIIVGDSADDYIISDESDTHYYYSFGSDFLTSTNYPCDLDVPDIMELNKDMFESVLAVSEILDMKHDDAMSKIYVYVDDKEFRECGIFMNISNNGNVITLGNDGRYRFVTRGLTHRTKKEIVSSLIKQYMQSLI